MNRLIVASKTRPDIGLPAFMGKYEFTVVPPSLFGPDGSFYKETKKADLANELRPLQIQPDNFDAEISGVLETNFRKVIIIDGMAFVNKVNIKNFQLGTCLDFAECFISMIKNETRGNKEVRYDPKSLKSNTRAARTKILQDLRYYKYWTRGN